MRAATVMEMMTEDPLQLQNSTDMSILSHTEDPVGRLQHSSEASWDSTISTMSLSFWTTNTTTAAADQLREYAILPEIDKILSIVLPIAALIGMLMNVAVLKNLVCSSLLNKPTRQLHGHLVISNCLQLVLCVPAISMVMFKGRKHSSDEDANKIISPIFCNISGYIFSVVMRQTIHISTLLSVDRLIAVQYPLVHKFKIQRWGYFWVLCFLWVFNLFTMATPFFVGNLYQLGMYECVCNWKFDMILPKSSGAQAALVTFYFILPFTITNFTTIFASFWIIIFLLKKNLVVQRRRTVRASAAPGSPSQYQILDQGEKPNGVDGTGVTNRLFATPNLNIRKAPISLTTDPKVKRACVTMLLVILLQLVCYSVIQVMILDNVLFRIFELNLLAHKVHHRYPWISQVMLNYPLYMLIFSIFIPFVIHFRMTRMARPANNAEPRTFVTTMHQMLRLKGSVRH